MLKLFLTAAAAAGTVAGTAAFAAALFGIGTADTGLAALFCPVQIKKYRTYNSQNNYNDYDIRHHTSHITLPFPLLTFFVELFILQSILSLEALFSLVDQHYYYCHHCCHSDQACNCSACIQGSRSGKQSTEGVYEVSYSVANAQLKTDAAPQRS